MQVSVQMQGFKELERKFLTLEKRIAKKAANRAARPAGNVIMKLARGKVPKVSKALMRAIRTRTIKANKAGIVGVTVGPSERWFVGDFFYGAFVEFGTIRMEAREYMKKAWQEGQNQAAEIMTSKLKSLITEEARRKV